MYIKRFKWSPAAALLITLGLAGCNSDDVKTNSDFDAIDPTAPVNDWQLVWSDEFDGDFIDENKWNFEIDCWGGGNNEQQCYTDNPENAYVSDGTLKIVALPTDDEEATNPYTSARLTSRNKGDFKYGRIEVRARMPHGQGSWPAVWMMPTDDVYGGWPRSGEIDIVEAVNLGVENADGEPETRVYGTLHYGRVWPDNDESGKGYTLPNDANPADDFNTYAIEWQEGEIRWYVNDYLYQTQMQSLVRVNSNNQPIGLRHRGWYVETFNQVTGELETVYSAAPFDQRFHLIMNLAVGGDWPENVNNLGIDEDAFADGQVFEIDYIRVYECAANPQTGRGCDTIRAGYKDEETLVTGLAPIPVPPSDGVARNLTIFAGTLNEDWAAWDCCAESAHGTVEDDDLGTVYRFIVGETATVNGFISRDEFLEDSEGSEAPFDASPLLETGSISFDMKVVSQPNNSSSTWLFKVESNYDRTHVQLPIAESLEGVDPATDTWQTVTFPLQDLADRGLDISAIDAVMVFPDWGTGEGAEYLLTNVMISAPSPELVLFSDDINPDWSLWDCCGGTSPSVVADPDRGNVAEFQVGAREAVLGFLAGDDIQFDASALMAEGVLQFDMKVVAAPADPNSVWKVKVESDGASSEAEVDLITGNGGVEPVTGEWATYTFPLQDLSDAGLDLAAIDVVMIFPAWGTGNGAIYHIDEARIYNPSSGASAVSVFNSGVMSGWSTAASSSLVNDIGATTVSHFEVHDQADTSPDFFAANGMAIDASSFLANGAISFDLRIVSLPDNHKATWVFHVESTNGTTEVELPLSAGNYGEDPVAGEWIRYHFPLNTLRKAGLDISSISAINISPESGNGQGAIYQVNNLDIANF